MSRATLVLINPEIRQKAIRWIGELPVGTRVEFKAPKRTLPQNDKFWALLTEVSEQVAWHGMRLTPDEWKLVFIDGLKRELKVVPALDGRGIVNLGRSSSDLSVPEFCDLIELVQAFGAEHGVVFNDLRLPHEIARKKSA